MFSRMWTYPKTTNLLTWLSVFATAPLGLAVLAYVAAAEASSVRSRATGTLNVTDEAHLRLVNTAGEALEEEGPATGALPGKVHVRFTVGASVKGTFVFYPRGGGSITGHGSAQLHSTSRYSSFAGTMAVSHGTGRYAHAHGRGGLYGVVDRRTDAMTIQTTGQLSY
jgi:hypothetical protein